MGQDTKIEWAHHTFNPWWGCVKVSPGCENCYALTLSKRYGHNVWGPAKTTSRRMMSEAYWKQPLKWNRAAQAVGTRARVFCASMADVFEEHPGVVEARARLFALIEATPNLDWLLLTKRPENIMRLMPRQWDESFYGIPANVWLGTSVEDQRRADERIPHLLRVPARIRFLSCEPLLGPVNLDHYLIDDWTRIGNDVHYHEHPPIHWLIVGGESGHGARPMHPDWTRALRDQAVAAGIVFHFKQWGEWLPFERCGVEGEGSYAAADGRLIPVDLLMRHAHEIHNDSGIVKLGKHAAGRLLDGREWNELPEARQ
jgi:protein gp37